MKEVKFYKYVVGSLIILNLLILVFFIFVKSSPPSPPPMDGKFINRSPAVLQLSAKQELEFSLFAENHGKEMEQIARQQASLLKPYFETLTSIEKSTPLDTMLLVYERLERQKVIATYKHFEEVKNMLEPEQLQNFDDFMEEALRRIIFDRNKRPRDRKKPRDRMKN